MRGSWAGIRSFFGGDTKIHPLMIDASEKRDSPVGRINVVSFKSSVSLAAMLLLLGGGCILSHRTAPDRSRAEFARDMAKIKEHMPQSEVLAILGQPDDVQTQLDTGGISSVQSGIIWCYGTKGHLTFPTLGYVCFDTNGRTHEVFGGRGQPPKSSLFTEDELQNLLRLLDSAPGLDSGTFDPLTLIQVVNTLHPLGREKSLAAIGEYLRVSRPWADFLGPRSGLFLVMRVLFDLPDGMGPCPEVPKINRPC